MVGGQKIKVIIVDDIAETRENIRKLLQFENDVDVVGVARTGREGIDLAKEVKPDVIIMDINMPDMDGITATESIRRVLPYIQIVILSVQNDSNYMRRAMLAGANDFLAKPPTVDDLTSAVRRAGNKAIEEKERSGRSAPVQTIGGSPISISTPSGKQGHIIVVYGPKGGLGCTTLAVNLAISLHSEDTPTVIVDGNLQFGDVAIFMNEQGKFSAVDLAPRVDELDNEIVDSVLLKHAPSGMRVLAAPYRPYEADNVTGEQFGKILNYLRRMFTYVVVDTASTLTEITLGALDVSHFIILNTAQEIPAIKNARLFLDLIDVLEIPRRRILFVVNRFDKRIAITAERIGENLKQEVIASIPFDDRTVIPAVNRGVPFIIADKTKPISRAVLSLGEVLRQRVVEAESEESEVSMDRRRLVNW